MSDNKDTFDPVAYRQAWEEWEKIEAEEYDCEMDELSQELFDELFWQDLEENPHQIASMTAPEKTYGVCLFVVELVGHLLKFVPEEFKTEEMCRAAIVSSNYSAEVLQFFPEAMNGITKRELYFSVIHERIHNDLRRLAVFELLHDTPLGSSVTEEEIEANIASLRLYSGL
jgi:hypothetical protein